MKGMKYYFLVLFLCVINSLQSNAQAIDALNPDRQPIHNKPITELSPMQIMEDSLVYFADSMYNSSMSEDRIDGSYGFIRLIKSMLRDKESFNYTFPKLKEKIVLLNSPDNNFRVYNWEVIRGESDKRYYGVIQLNDGSYIPLVDVSDQIIRGAEDSTFNGTRWYGCLYYNILKREVNGQSVYFFMGWNGSGMNSEKKIVDAFGFNSRGQSQFGAPFFSILERGHRKKPNRFVYEYQKGANVSLSYDKETDQIIFDHCESQIGDAAKRYTYIPDGSYDGLKWDGQQWFMQENIIQMQDLKQGNAPVEKPIKK